MRTNIDIDDELMEKTMEVTGKTTKRAAIDSALREFLQIRSQAGIRKLRGKVKWEGNLEESRLGRVFH